MLFVWIDGFVVVENHQVAGGGWVEDKHLIKLGYQLVHRHNKYVFKVYPIVFDRKLEQDLAGRALIGDAEQKQSQIVIVDQVFAISHWNWTGLDNLKSLAVQQVQYTIAQSQDAVAHSCVIHSICDFFDLFPQRNGGLELDLRFCAEGTGDRIVSDGSIKEWIDVQ